MSEQDHVARFANAVAGYRDRHRRHKEYGRKRRCHYGEREVNVDRTRQEPHRQDYEPLEGSAEEHRSPDDVPPDTGA